MTDLAVRPNHMDFNYLQRVKVYRLNDEGKWDDKGTGHVSVEYLERSDAVGLVVIDEEDNQTLLVHRISADDIYRRQEDTIISWTDPEVATDLALSFQETMGCSFIWRRCHYRRDQICSVQRSIHFPSVGGMEGSTRTAGDDLDHSGTSQDDDDAFREGGGGEVLELPPVELSTLPLIAKTVAEVMPFDRDRVASMIVRDQNYIPKLVQLFHTCEDLENLEGLRLIFKIVKGIISLNDGHIFDIIFSDDYIMDIIGALEYDSDVTKARGHRTFLKEQVVFKEVVPIRDPVILSKIHQTYRIGYIKDVILPRGLDDPTFATLNSIILFNNVSVVTALHNDSAFLSELFSKLRSPEISERQRRDLVFFIQEFCNLSKHLQPLVRSQLFSALAKEGLFEIVKDILKDADEAVRLSGCDILIVIMNHDPTLLRSFLVHQPSYTLFSELVEGMLTPSEGGLQAQLLEIMRMLLDSETLELPAVDRSLFLEIFYDKYMDQMVQLLTDGCPSESGNLEPANDSVDAGKRTRRIVSPEILGNICELMCFCVQHHRFRIKYYVMKHHVVEKILKLVRRKEKYLVVAAVRFLRTCVSLKDEFYFRYIVKHNLFEPIIGAFVANGNRYNLLNSAVLELIDFIRKEGIKILIVYLIEKHSSKLESIDYVDTFRALKLKYDQLLEGPPSTRDAGGAITSGTPNHGSRMGCDRLSQAGLPDTRRRKDERALDKDEEEYFNEDSDDEEDTATARVCTPSQLHSKQPVTINGSALGAVPSRRTTVGLVDYEDEDEDLPPALGINRKDSGGVLDKKSESIPPATFLTDPIWQEVEDGSISKRKVYLAPNSEPPGTTSFKRQKPEDGHAADRSNSEPYLSGLVDSSGAESVETCSEVPGLAKSSILGSIPPAQDITSKMCKAEDSIATSVDQHGPGDMNQASSSDHTGRGNPEVISDMDVQHAHQDSETAASESGSAPLGDIVDLVATEAQLLNDRPAEVASVEMEKASACVEDNISKNGPEDLLREKCVNGGESPPKSLDVGCSFATERGSTQNGLDCYSVEDCNGSTSESSERVGVGAIPIKGVSDSSSSVLQQSASLGSEGNKVSNLGTDIMRAVTPTSPGPYTVR
nr:serine/threonine-protein phosphatase 4 regulatory subunit 3-like isoform X2 [Physcomitrium patens]|eukprot:XP_024370707.1 serine/threonine-protein phosphatase 4 regulatory subunit 3-like isoform X2 [Physcomitrella patens]